MRVSASQIKSFVTCPSMWYWNSIQKIRPPETKPLIFGSAFHIAVEFYLQAKGKIPADFESLKQNYRHFCLRIKEKDMDETTHNREINDLKALEITTTEYSLIKRLLQNAKDKLNTWMTHPGVALEMAISGEFPYVEGVTYSGFIDLLLVDEKNGRVFIFDHKTTSSFDYCETEQTLKDNIQLMLYASYISKKYPKMSIVVGHIQYNKKTAQVQSVKAVITKDDIERKLKSLSEPVGQMLDIWSKYRDLPEEAKTDVRRETSNCKLYATKTNPGCAYQGICHNNFPHERLRESFERDKLAALGGAQSINAGMDKAANVVPRTKTFREKMLEDSSKIDPLSSLTNKTKEPLYRGVDEVEVEKGESYNKEDAKEETVIHFSEFEEVRLRNDTEFITEYLDLQIAIYEDNSEELLERIGKKLMPIAEVISEYEGKKSTRKTQGLRAYKIYVENIRVYNAHGKDLGDVGLTMSILGFEPEDPKTEEANAQVVDSIIVEYKKEEDPIAEPIAEPIVEPIAEPIAEKVVEPIAEPIAEKVVEKVVETSTPKTLFLVDSCVTKKADIKRLSEFYRYAEEKLEMEYTLNDIRTHEYNKPVKGMLNYSGGILKAIKDSGTAFILVNSSDVVDAILVNYFERHGELVIRGTR